MKLWSRRLWGLGFRVYVVGLSAGLLCFATRGTNMALRNPEPQTLFLNPKRVLQAVGVEPLVRAKVKGWGLASKGRFPCWSDEQLEFELWADMIQDQAKMDAAKWPTLKSSA